MPDRVDAPMDDVQPPGFAPVCDRAGAKTAADQLSPRNDPMLALDDPRDPILEPLRTTLGLYFSPNYIGVWHEGPVWPGRSGELGPW